MFGCFMKGPGSAPSGSGKVWDEKTEANLEEGVERVPGTRFGESISYPRLGRDCWSEGKKRPNAEAGVGRSKGHKYRRQRS